MSYTSRKGAVLVGSVGLLCLMGGLSGPRHSAADEVPAVVEDVPGPPGEELVADRTFVPGPSQGGVSGSRRILRISADPNNLPFTNRRLEGFENKLAELLARELDVDLEYVWRAQRRGFLRQALQEGECDLILGVPSDTERVLTTLPYYRSSYVFVSRQERGLSVRSFDDMLLRKLRVGVQIVGEDRCATPPAHALARRGIFENVVGYSVYGDYAEESPPARIVKGVAGGEVDIAVVWGPQAGYLAQRQLVALTLTPVSPEGAPPALRSTFDISLGVRRGDKELQERLNLILGEHRAEIGKILDAYGVPRLTPAVPLVVAPVPVTSATSPSATSSRPAPR